MVEVSSHTRLEITPASARDIYLARSESKVPSPSAPTTLFIPTTGVLRSNAGSLAWIDTAYAQGLATRHFLDSINRGDIPAALNPSCQHSVDIKLFHQSPTRLSERSVTLIEALGVATILESLARQSTTLLCPNCGALSERYPSHSQALSVLQEKLTGPCTVFAEGPTDALTAWSHAHGFRPPRTDTTQTSSRLRVQIDSLNSQTDAITRLSQLMHSLWRLRDASVVCVEESGTLTLSKHGTCLGCGYSFIDDRTVGSSGTLRWPDLSSRVLPHGRSCRQLLVAPLHEHAAIPALANSTALSYALRTPLGDRAANTRTSVLSASELAVVAACRSLADALDGHGTCVIDLPAPLLSSEASSTIFAMVSEAASAIGVVLVESSDEKQLIPLRRAQNSAPGRPIGTLRVHSVDYPIEAGKDLTLTGISFKDAEALLQHNSQTETDNIFTPASQYDVISIPVFKSFRRSRTMLVNQLGLAEALANLFAASVDARSAGLTARDFTLSSGRTNKNLCATCNGLGVTLHYIEELSRASVSRCRTCEGSRFANDVGNMSWRGVSLSALLNTPIGEILLLLRALPRALDASTCLEALCLTHLPLGMPLSLMSDSELHALLLIQALLSATASKPIIALIESPLSSLNARQHDGALRLLQSSSRANHLSLVIV
jgi:hypothetical protein